MSGVIGVLRDGLPGIIDALSICVALLIIIIVNSANNYQSERKLRDLVALSDKVVVEVYRNSDVPITIDSTDLVVGDVFMLSMGMKIPADSIVLQSQDLISDESALTGESDGIVKEAVSETS